MVIRRRWILLVPLALGLATAPYVAKHLPKVFKSETLIMVIPQRVPESYVKSTVTSTIGDRLPGISDQILSRSRLERIIGDFDLYRDQRAKAPMEDIVRRMRDDIGDPQIQAGAQSFRISYVSQDPATAQKVTARLASLFIEENSRERENQAESTNVFLESQLEDAKLRLLEKEKRLEEFKTRNSGELPSQLDGNLRAISSAQLQLQSVSETRNRAQERRLLIERQLVDAQTAPASVVAQGLPEAQIQQSAAQQLATAQKTLDVMKLRYTPDHPDVRTMERTIRELKDRVAEEARRPASPVDKTPSPAEAERERKIRNLQAEMGVIDHQLAQNEADEARLKLSISDYQRKVESVPRRESELVELTRDYEVLKATYDGLQVKREDSKLSANLERRQIGEQFRILDQASLPVRPANQTQRLMTSFGGSVVGLLIGLLLAGFLEFRDSSFKEEEDVLRVLTLPVLAMVPTMASPREQSSTRRRRIIVDLAAGAVVFGSALVLVVWGLG